MSEKKAGLKGLVATVTAGAMSVAMSACSVFSPGGNVPANVYGPPPQEDPPVISQPEDNPKSEENDPSANVPAVVYGPPQNDPGMQAPFDPTNNIPEDVYGPPVESPVLEENQ